MYSHEIQSLLEENNYTLSSQDYLFMCDSSPQIKQIKYTPFENYFEIWTSDDYYWRFKVQVNK